MDIKISSTDFLSKFKDNLFSNFFKFDSKKRKQFIDFLKEHNVSIGGGYITSLLYDIDVRYKKPYLIISNENAEEFILNMFPGFVIIETGLSKYKYKDQYYNVNNMYQYIQLKFITGSRNLSEITCYIYKRGYFEDFLKNFEDISLCELYYDPIEDKINIDNIEQFKKNIGELKYIGEDMEVDIEDNDNIELFNEMCKENRICTLLKEKDVLFIPQSRNSNFYISENYKDVEKDIIILTLKSITGSSLVNLDDVDDIEYDLNMKYFLLSLDHIYI
jgi:hypothetical protein